MTYRQLRKDLLAHLAVTPQRLSQLTKGAKRDHGPMSTREAVCLLAHLKGLDVAKYLDPADVERVRQLRPPSGQAPPPLAKKPRLGARMPAQVTIGRDVQLADPVLPRRTINEAKLMAERVYPIMYIFENSVREVIGLVMARANGDGWWQISAPREVRQKVEGRIQKEERTPWHGKRGAHPIYYTDIDDLTRIVRDRRNWPHFAPLFPSQTWLTQRVEEITPSRNVIAHSNPLGQDDIKRLEVYLTDWQNQVRHCLQQGLL